MPNLKGICYLCEESKNLCKEHESRRSGRPCSDRVYQRRNPAGVSASTQERGGGNEYFEYDEEAVFEIVRKDEYEKGHQEGVIAGKAEDILELLEDIGTIPEEVREKITGEIDLEILKKWHKLAAKSESIDEFV